MPTSKSQPGSSSDIELPVLTPWHGRSFQPLSLERGSFSSPDSETNPKNGAANSTAAVDEIEPPTPAYFPPLNDIPPISTLDDGLAEYTRLHGHSEIPVTPRQLEDGRASVRTGETRPESLPTYRVDNPPKYSLRQRAPEEPTTWTTICFRLGFMFPPLWLCGALALVVPQGSLDRIFVSWFDDFIPSADAYCDNLQTEAEKEVFLARMRVAELRWAKRCFFAFSLEVCFLIAVAVTIVGVTKVH